MRKMLFDAIPPSVSSPGKSVSASTHAGASCAFELRDIAWRRSSQALDGTGCAIASAGAGKASVSASCAETRQTIARKIANAARANIDCARVFTPNPLCKLSLLMGSNLQAVRHFKHRRQNAEHNQAHQNGDHHYDYRGNQLRNYADRFIKLAFIHVGDSLHRFREMSGLFADGHHVREQIRKELLLLQGSRERRAINHRRAHLTKFPFQKTVGGDFRY